MSRMTPKRRVLAVASSGGHWMQMMRLRDAFDGTEVHYATVDRAAAADVALAPVWKFTDANRNTKWRLILSALQIAWIVLQVRPHAIVSTVAAPGYLAIRLGKLIGARGMFIDSIANASERSMSARLARRHADRLLS